ncbi:uncharacterized protein LOC125842780 [Solanum stenotomum]|uniref:uncharacterized protein LOC125842780 n=1 Tax=Solanum stenotomum TaxID=172797 RepID=UPI0020CFEF3D|nr:uncharacterized protein LOC125842780 [Solanum stenotomum]
MHLTRLTQKEVLLDWTDKCKESFQKLKTLLTISHIQDLPVEGKDFTVYCDASLLGLCAVLMQDKNVIAYASRQLEVHERNYVVRDKLAEKELNLRKRRWMELLKDCNVTIQYHPGKGNVVADALSLKTKGGVLAIIEIRPTFIEEIKVKQFEDESLNELRKKIASGKA